MKNFIKRLFADILRLAIIAAFIIAAIYAVCFVLSLPEILGMLIF